MQLFIGGARVGSGRQRLANLRRAQVPHRGHEIGYGIVPMARAERRLRDLNGWFNQEAAVAAERVWYVRHGLVMALGQD